MKKFLFTLFMMCFPLWVGAENDIVVDRVKYSINTETQEASVAYFNNYGDVVISDVVLYNGVTYPVTSIGRNAFYDCSSVTSVTIPNSVTSIGMGAFRGCSGLTSVTIPNSVTSIGTGAFYLCNNLTSVHITDLEAWCRIAFSQELYDWGGVGSYANPLYYAHHLYLNNEEIKDLVIPNSITSISDFAFYGCSGMTTVTIPNSNISIGDNTFLHCDAIQTVTLDCKEVGKWFKGNTHIKNLILGNNVTSIGDYAFYGCSGMTNVTIPYSVTSIGDYAFYGCKGLTSIDIPNSVTSIGDYAFSGCSGLTSPVYNEKIFARMPQYYEGEYAISDGITTICCGAFSLCGGLTSIDIPNSVTSIGDEAFYKCYSMTSIPIPNSVTSIGRAAFANCSNLISVNIPNGVTSISENTFYQCRKLNRVTIPNSVTSIGKEAFWECGNLESVYITDISKWCQITFECNPFWYAKHLYLNGEEVKDLVIPNDVTFISDGAFTGCNGLTSVTIPNSVKTIGEWAFQDCDGLTSVTIPNSVTDIYNCTFNNCSSLVSVIIPNSVTSLGYLVFEGCTSLKDVYCYAENVPKDYGAFTDNIENATLYVPAASLGQYETTAPWSGFGKIVPLTDEETAINLPQAEENWTENEVQQIYTLDGKPAKTLQKGVIILRTSDGQTKKVLVK